MQPKTRKRLWLIGVPLVVVAGTAGFIWGGVYNVAADDMHTKLVYFLLETARERSILARAGRLDVPPGLDDPARIVQGAGNYAAMCAGCHLAPSMAETELSQVLRPSISLDTLLRDPNPKRRVRDEAQEGRVGEGARPLVGEVQA